MAKKSEAKNGANGQPGMNGTSANNGSSGQNGVTFTNSLDEAAIGDLVNKLKALPGGNSLELINDNDRIQVKLNGVVLVDINKTELSKNQQS